MKIFITLLMIFFCLPSKAQHRKFCITGYFSGKASYLDSFEIGKLTHIIYSFGHLQGNRLHINNSGDTATIRKMVSFKAEYPTLKVILSLGGWGGCKECSAVFSTEAGRKEFAKSSKALIDYFGADGIDLDWEYPVIQGYPGHRYDPADKSNFTKLVQQLRQVLGNDKEISFAAGGFAQYIEQSIDWNTVMKIVDKVYIMSYDLVHGYSKQSGHHTPLYSTSEQLVSTDLAVNLLLKKNVPSRKIVIGAAFYARMFEVADTVNKGLYRPGKFYRGISYSNLYDSISVANGFVQYWDLVAQAPYAFNPSRKILVTYDDQLSVTRKTKYALSKKLGGIMFWQLMDDKYRDGLLQAIYRAVD